MNNAGTEKDRATLEKCISQSFMLRSRDGPICCCYSLVAFLFKNPSLVVQNRKRVKSKYLIFFFKGSSNGLFFLNTSGTIVFSCIFALLFSRSQNLIGICPSLRNHFYFVFAGEENSRVQAHIEGDEFSAHILTDETEYNIEVRAGCKIILFLCGI